MTEQHVAILRRFADRIVLLFDADTAGDLAVNRAVELFLTQPIEIAIASMPEGLDPDEYVMQHGREGFEKLLAGAQDALSFKWKQLLRDFGAKGDLTSQQKAVEQYLELLADARGRGPVDSLRWGAVLTRVSRLTQIPVDQLNQRFPGKKQKIGRNLAVQAATRAQPISSGPSTGIIDADARAERWLLGAVLAQPERWQQVQLHVGPQDFSDELRRALAEIVWSHQRDEGELAFNDLLGMLDDPQLKELAVSMLEDVQAMDALEQMLKDALQHLQASRGRQAQQKLVARLQETQPAEHADDEANLLRQLQERARQPDIRRAAT